MKAFEAKAVRLAAWAKALGHPARVAILRFLAERRACFCGQIVDVLPLAQSTVSQHLRELKEAGLVQGTVDGVKVCYCLEPGTLADARETFGRLFEELCGTAAAEARAGDGCCGPEGGRGAGATWSSQSNARSGAAGAATLYPRLASYVAARVTEFGQIPADRRERLGELSAYVARARASVATPRLNFICTHNSRRSQMGQVWARAAAVVHGIEGIEVFSGGTEATAFNPRAVAALERAGMRIERLTGGENPLHLVRVGEAVEPAVCFSKVYDQPPNPRADYCAVMTCAEADAGCPVVRGAAARVSLGYDDPKQADGTPAEEARYDERCAQIAREMLYAFARVLQFESARAV